MVKGGILGQNVREGGKGTGTADRQRNNSQAKKASKRGPSMG